jgi:hypothetical protein
MSAAVLQGVPYATLDTDIWIDLPPRQYIRVLNVCQRLGAHVVANTVVTLVDDSVVNFLYRVDGLRPFNSEYRAAKSMVWLAQTVKVLPVRRLYQSKKVVGRTKDLAHLPILKAFLACDRQLSKPQRSSASNRPVASGSFLPPRLVWPV